MVARKANAAKRSIRRRAVGRLVPVDHAGADIGPELVVELGTVADQARREPEPRVVGFVNCRIEIPDPDDLKYRSKDFLVRTLLDIGDVDQCGS